MALIQKIVLHTLGMLPGGSMKPGGKFPRLPRVNHGDRSADDGSIWEDPGNRMSELPVPALRGMGMEDAAAQLKKACKK